MDQQKTLIIWALYMLLLIIGGICLAVASYWQGDIETATSLMLWTGRGALASFAVLMLTSLSMHFRQP